MPPASRIDPMMLPALLSLAVGRFNRSVCARWPRAIQDLQRPFVRGHLSAPAARARTSLPELQRGGGARHIVHAMRASLCALSGALFAIGLVHPSLAADAPAHPTATAPSDQVRKELLAARETAWRSFVQKDADAVEGILAPELIAIQESSDQWENRERLVKLAKSMGERGVQMTRLEFPRTEIQVFGDTAILYYTYIMEQRLGEQMSVRAGRGTEVFVRRNGRWVDVGWHLDNGAFRQKDGAWIRLGEALPTPSR
jgi:ketosteroid isomerase-like protein